MKTSVSLPMSSDVWLLLHDTIRTINDSFRNLLILLGFSLITANVGLPKIFVYFHYPFPPRSSPYSLLRYVKRTFCRSFHRSNALASNFTRIQVKQKGPIERLIIPFTTDLRKWRRRKAHSRRFWPARTCSRSRALPGIRPKNLPDHHHFLNGISCPQIVAARRPGSHIHR